MPRKSNKVWDDSSSYSGWTQVTGQSGNNGMGRSKSEFAEIKEYIREKFEVPLFGILYAMVKENSFSKYFVMLNLAVELFQLVTFSFKPMFPWSSESASSVLDFTSVGSNSWISYRAFTVIFWFAVGFIILMIANAAHVGFTFMQGHVNSIFLLRTLRWLGSLFVSVLFIPILNVLMMGLSCTSSGALSSYHTVDCWGSQNVAVAVVGIIMAVVFSLIAFLTCLTYYEYDYSIPKGFSRLQNRFELLVLIVKTVLVLVSSFLLTKAVPLGVVFLMCSIVLFVGSIVLMPVYNVNVNRARSGIYAAVLWTNISLMIALAMNDSHSNVPIIIFGIGLIPAGFLGVLAVNLRFKYLCNPDLIIPSGDVDIITLPGTNLGGRGRKVQWEEHKEGTLGQGNKYVNAKLYNRLLFPSDVEIAARFALTEKPSAVTTDKAKAVYAMGMMKFPKSATVLQAYVNFIFTVLGDWQLGYSTLEKLRMMYPALDIRFFIYRYDKDREQKIEAGGTVRFGDFVNFMEFKKLHRSAKRFHIEAIRARRQFWRLLLKKNVDANELSLLSAKIATSESKASEHYDQLLSRYPNNVRGLRDYARFVDEMLNDNKTAQKIWAKADRLEELETAKATTSYRGNEMTRGGSAEHPGAMPDEHEGHNPESEHGGESSTGLSDPASHDDFSDGTSHPDDDRSESSKSSGFTRSLDQAHSAKTTDLKRLSWIMFFTTCAAIVICVVQVAVLTSQLKQYGVVLQQLEGATSVGYQASQLATDLLDTVYLANASVQLHENGLLTASGLDYPACMTRGTTLSNQIGNTVKALYWGASTYDYFMSSRLTNLKREHGMSVSGVASAREMTYDDFTHKGVAKSVKDFMEDPVVQTITYTPDPNYTESYVFGNFAYDTTELTSFWRLSMLYIQQAKVVFSLNKTTLGNATLMLDYSNPYNYLIGNPSIFTDQTIKLSNTLSDKVKSSNTMLVIVAGILLAFAVSALILVASTLFRIVVNNIFDHKMKTLHLFATIPRKIVRVMLKKKFKQLRTGADTTTDDDTDKNPESDNEKPIKEKKSKKSKKLKRAPTPRISLAVGESSESLLRPDYTTPGEYVTPGANYVTPGGDDETPGSGYVTLGGPLPGAIHVAEEQKEETDPEPADEREEVEYSLASAIVNVRPASGSGALIPLLPLSRDGKEKKDSAKNGEENKAGTPEEKSSSDDGKKKKSRIDTRSINKVTHKLHLSYVFAILLFIICFVISFVVERNSFVQMNNISKNVQNAALRTQYMRTVLYDLSLYAYYPTGHMLAKAAQADGLAKLEILHQINQLVPVPNNQMSLFFDSDCIRVNKSLCLDPTSPFYQYTSHGLDFLLSQWMDLAKDVLQRPVIWTTDDSYVNLRWLGDNDLFDGLETAMFYFCFDGQNLVDSAVTSLAIIVCVDVVAFVIIHLLVFKRFVRQLQSENEHTFSIIRMIPRHMLNMIGEIKELVQDNKEDV